MRRQPVKDAIERPELAQKGSQCRGFIRALQQEGHPHMPEPQGPRYTCPDGAGMRKVTESCKGPFEILLRRIDRLQDVAMPLQQSNLGNQGDDIGITRGDGTIVPAAVSREKTARLLHAGVERGPG